MEKLITGIHRFRRQYWRDNKDLFQRLARHGQSPDELFITCSDSRVDPTVFTQRQPGDLFIYRNIGNFVPPYIDGRLDRTGAGAAIEYAVDHLRVHDIIVCGHSDCGAMNALYKDRKAFAESPHITEWLKHGDGTLKVLEDNYPEKSKEERLAIISQENVLVQMENLRTYPVVKKAAREGRLHVHAWFFEIGAAKMYAYNPDKGQYELLHLEEE